MAGGAPRRKGMLREVYKDGEAEILVWRAEEGSRWGIIAPQTISCEWQSACAPKLTNREMRGSDSSTTSKVCLTEYVSSLEHIKIVRCEQASSYALLLRLTEPHYCQELQQRWLGRRYNDLQPARIVLRELQSVEFNCSELNFLTFILSRLDLAESELLEPDYIFEAEALENLAQNFSHQCKLCHEHLLYEDHPQPIITTLCCHSFHLKCLKQYNQRQPGCPTCRYHIWPQPIIHCQQCNEYEELWMCKQCYCRLCGLVDPAKTTQSHAFQHLKKTGHCNFMSLQTLDTFQFQKTDSKDQQGLSNYLPNCPQMSKREFLKECLRMEVQRVKQQMELQGAKFQSESSRISKEAYERFEKQMKVYTKTKIEIDSIKPPTFNQQQEEQQIAQLERQLEVQLKVKKLMSERVENMLANIAALKEAEPAVLNQLDKRIEMARKELKAIDESRLEYQMQLKAEHQHSSKKSGKQRSVATIIITATNITLTASSDGKSGTK